jgi:hypothetical protein
MQPATSSGRGSLKRYPPIYQVAPGAGDSLSPPERAALSDQADEIAADLTVLHRDGSLELVIPDVIHVKGDRWTGPNGRPRMTHAGWMAQRRWKTNMGD